MKVGRRHRNQTGIHRMEVDLGQRKNDRQTDIRERQTIQEADRQT